MTYPKPGPFIQKILLRTALYELIVFLVISRDRLLAEMVHGTDPLRMVRQFPLHRRHPLLILAGFTVSSVRQMPRAGGVHRHADHRYRCPTGIRGPRRLWGFTGF